MVKKIHSINIDEDIWNEAKSKGFNMSQFLENQLKIAIEGGSNNELELKQRLITIEQEIIILQQEAEIIKSQLSNILTDELSQTEKQQRLWKKIIQDQNQYGMIKTTDVEEATVILGYSMELIREKVAYLIEEKNQQFETRENIQNWDYVKKNYFEGI